MLGQNKDQGRKRWQQYRKLGRTKFIIMFSLYFSLVLAVVNFLGDFAAYGFASPHLAVLRFAVYIVVSPLMGYIIWRVSESKYIKQDRQDKA